ncbi:FG-GAP-like repeat-containing protein [Flavobacterium selenitireducens]|uniref:FG-GAP-like repeat-containing protein n=1 Tax=Flavobacterium selenitireducens TaxID=2722704 RepID=UPI00168B50B4|nr:T9SS type A sorting domain-containing protein [Flavobacterium selenitireducens]MBD3583494.1 T9SS type A sorting domain-containing protein [Flavobacterium selenitireducens]
MPKKLLSALFLLVVSANVSGQIGFYENIATGFAYTTQRPHLVRAADFDGDGDTDVVTHGSGLNWYENEDGQGNFGQKKTIEVQLTATIGGTLETVDFDNDGDVDILVSAGNRLNVYRNTDGQGNFALMQSFTLGTSSSSPISAMPVDMNDDGLLDILCYYNNGGGAFQGWISWFANTGAGAFGAQQILNNTASDLIYGTLLHADDLDNDNDLDIILGYGNINKIAWFENTGNNVYASPVTISTTAGAISSITTADLDNDGDKDIIAAHKNDNQVAWYENLDGAGSFADEFVVTSSATSTYCVLVTDINNDNNPDVVYTGGDEIGWLSNADGSGSNFGTAQVITTKAYGVRSVITADIDGDGKQDLVSASYDDDKIAWYKNIDGNGTFGRQVGIGRSVDSPNNVYPGDFDGDGDLDLLVNSQHDAKLTWLENVNGIGFFGKEHIITESVTVGNQTPIAYPVDIDGDGDLDIASRQGTNLFWWNNDGDGNFTYQLIHNANLATIIRSGDFDGDGDMDLLTGVYNSDKLSWYRNLGSGNFAAEQVIFDTNDDNGSMTSLQIADMDGDGDMDFIVSSYNSYTNYYKNTDGQGTFADQNVIVFDWLMSVYPADIDGDGDLDVVGVASNGGGAFEAVVWYENTGQGAFTIEHDVSTLTIHGQDITAADIDNDGDIDVLTAAGHENTSGQLAWYQNNGDGTFAARQMIHERFDTSIAEAVTTADIDNDGRRDVVSIFGRWNSSTLGKVSVFKNLGELGNTISGTVTIDTDSNGCTADDPKASNMLVIAQNTGNSFATFTNANGGFQMEANPGSYVTFITSNLPEYFTAAPASHTFNFNGMNNQYTANFCVTPVGVVNDVTVSVYPLDEPRPGFRSRYRIVYRNNGTAASSGTVSFTYTGNKLSFVSASQAVSAQTPNTLVFDYADLSLFETRTIDLEFMAFAPPTTNNGDVATSVVSISPVAGDAALGDNTLTLNQIFVGSYDPNDITCLEGDALPLADADKYLHYAIRFQNSGTASAINVRVQHELDPKLDWTTLQLEGTSHTARTTITNENLVEFIFNDIYLPHSDADEPGSNGYVLFRIKPTADTIIDGDTVHATADIFFDFNPPITTNTASTTYSSLGVDPVSARPVVIHPNPAKDQLAIHSADEILKVRIHNLLGVGVFEAKGKSAFDVSGLESGVYLMTITTEKGELVKRFIKQ